MLDLIPFAGARWIMANSLLQSRLIGPPLQFHLPESNAIPTTAPAIGTNQHLLSLRIECLAHLAPPTANAFHGKTGRVMRTAYRHPPQVVLQVVNSTRDRLGHVRIREIMDIDLLGFSGRLPFLPGIGVVSDEFLLFGIDRDDRPALPQKGLPLALDLAKLGVTIGMLLPFFGLGIALQTVVQGMQQLGDFHVTDRMPLCREKVG